MTDTKELDELEEILNRIVSQEAITEGGYAEYALNDDDIKYGNPVHNKEELKQAILVYISKHYISRNDKRY